MKPNENLKIKFVKNLDISAKAICLFWLKEIHIDESLRNHPCLEELIKHETKHYNIIQKALKSNRVMRWVYIIYNNLWDFWDVFRIQFLFFKKECIINFILPLSTFIVYFFWWFFLK